MYQIFVVGLSKVIFEKSTCRKRQMLKNVSKNLYEKNFDKLFFRGNVLINTKIKCKINFI